MSLESLEKAICEAGSDNAEFFGGIWTGGYYIQQDPKEFAQLVQFLKDYSAIKNFKHYLAIGVAAGGVERFLVENCEIESLTIIDNGEHPAHKHWNANCNAIDRLTGGTDEFIGDSHSKKAAHFLWDICDELSMKFGLIGIDGDHSPQGVLQDWEMVQPYLAPGCLVWLHDILIDIPGQSGARKLFARLKEKYEVLLQTNGKFGIAVLRVP